jgi:hypothetical protein
MMYSGQGSLYARTGLGAYRAGLPLARWHAGMLV